MTEAELEAALLADPELFPAADPVVEAVELVVEGASAAATTAVDTATHRRRDAVGSVVQTPPAPTTP